MKTGIALLAALALMVGPEIAQARYLPASTAYRAIYWNNQRAEREVDWEDRLELGECGRFSQGRYECQVELEGRELVEYDPERGLVHLVRFCGWVAVAHWRGRHVVVNRRGLACYQRYETSR